MARIAGVNILSAKRLDVALTYIHGIGRVKSSEICEKAGLPPEKRVHQLSASEVIKVREIIDRDYAVEGDLRREVSFMWHLS